MKVLAILCAAILGATALASRGAVATMVDDQFNAKATEWAEGVVTNVKDGRVQVSGAKSPYAGDYAAFHREFFSFPETERELQRKKLQERFQGRMGYHASKEKPLTFTFTVADPANTVVFDEASNYGTTLALWRYPEKTTLYKFNDLKAGDRVVVGYDSSEQVQSIMRVSPVILMSGENNEAPRAQGSDLIDKNGVHVMNKSSNETNPIPPNRPNRPTTGSGGSSTSTETSNNNRYGYSDYPLVIPPTQSNNNQTWNDASSTNDARTQPPNSQTPGTASSVQTGQDPVVPPNPSRPINSSDPNPTRARSQEQQSHPSQFNKPDNTPSALTGPADNAPQYPNNPTTVEAEQGRPVTPRDTRDNPNYTPPPHPNPAANPGMNTTSGANNNGSLGNGSNTNGQNTNNYGQPTSPTANGQPNQSGGYSPPNNGTNPRVVPGRGTSR